MLRVILVSSYLSGAEGENNLRYFERLDGVPRAMGHRLLLLNTKSEQVRSACDSVHLPMFIEKAHHLRLEGRLRAEALAPAVRHAASIDAEEWRRDPLADAVRALFYRAYLRDLVREHDPALCVFWHQFNSLHHSMPDFCAGLGAPMLFAEYGSLPATIAFDSEGQMAESWVARRSDEFLNLPVSDDELSRTRRFLELARKQRQTRKPAAASVSIQAVSEVAARSGRKLVFYAGQHDYKTGMAPRSLPNAALHSPFFESTDDALQHLCAIARERNWHILFKPHPLARHLLERADIPDAEWLDVVPDADIFECMDAAAVTVTIVSQVSYMALLHERPCVLLGRNQLSGKGCVYEPSSREEAGGRIDEAIAAGLTQQQREAWFKHAAQLLGNALYAFEENVEPIIGRDVHEAASFLVEYAENASADAKAGRAEAIRRPFGDDLSDEEAARYLGIRHALLRSIDPLAGPIVNSFARLLRPLLRRGKS